MQVIKPGTKVYCKTGYTGLTVIGEVVEYDHHMGDFVSGFGRYLVKVTESKSDLVQLGQARWAHPSKVWSF